jgi:hypothetical protein
MTWSEDKIKQLEADYANLAPYDRAVIIRQLQERADHERRQAERKSQRQERAREARIYDEEAKLIEVPRGQQPGEDWTAEDEAQHRREWKKLRSEPALLEVGSPDVPEKRIEFPALPVQESYEVHRLGDPGFEPETPAERRAIERFTYIDSSCRVQGSDDAG